MTGGALAPSLGLHSVVGASASASKKGGWDKEPSPKGLVNAGTFRREEGSRTMPKRATRQAGTSDAPSTTGVPVTERDAALEFSAVVIPFSYGHLAQASKRGKEAAKKWKEGRSLPSAWSMLNMAREIPAVRAWMMAKLGDSPHVQFNSAQGIDVLARAMQSLANMPGPDGEAIRALMHGAQIKPGGRA